jgi:hypothetical protein
MSTDVEVPGRVLTPPAPGAESAGPALVDLVQDLGHTVRVMQSLFMDARRDLRYRYQTVRAQFQCDANGDGAVELFEVPQGAVAALVILAIDSGGAAITPANPDTGANLWHAIYAAGGGSGTAAQVAAKGNLLDCRPNAPTPDAQIPFAYVYGSEQAAPRLQGPEAFYLVVDAAAANSQILARGVVCIEQPET